MYWSCKFALKRHPLAVRQWWDLESRSTIICATLPTRSLGDHGWSLLTTPMPLLWTSHHHRTLMKSLLGKGGNGSKPLCCSVFEAVEFLERDVNQCETCRMQPCNLLLHWHPSTQSLGLDRWDWMNHEPSCKNGKQNRETTVKTSMHVHVGKSCTGTRKNETVKKQRHGRAWGPHPSGGVNIAHQARSRGLRALVDSCWWCKAGKNGWTTSKNQWNPLLHF